MSSKLLLAAIALGLWVNAAALGLKPAQAQSDFLLRGMGGTLSST